MGKSIHHQLRNAIKCYNPGKADATKLEALLKNGADPGVKSRKGYDAFHLAIGMGWYDAVKLFLEHGFNINSGSSPWELLQTQICCILHDSDAPSNEKREQLQPYKKIFFLLLKRANPLLTPSTIRKMAIKANLRFFRKEPGKKHLLKGGKAKRVESDIRKLRRDVSSEQRKTHTLDIGQVPFRSLVLANNQALEAAFDDAGYLTDDEADMGTAAEAVKGKWQKEHRKNYTDQPAFEIFEYQNTSFPEPEPVYPFGKMSNMFFATKPNPTERQPGNVLVAGAPHYATKPDATKPAVIDKLKSVTGETAPKKEKKLARLMRRSARTGQPIDAASLKTSMKKKKELTPKTMLGLNAINQLRGSTEVHRRLFRFSNGKTAHKIDEIPMGVTQAMALELVVNGVLSLDQVFGRDDLVGLPNQRGLTSKPSIAKVKKQLSVLLFIYLLTHLDKGHDISLLNAEHFHQLLLQHYGGADESESDCEPYSDNALAGIKDLSEMSSEEPSSEESSESNSSSESSPCTSDQESIKSLTSSPSLSAISSEQESTKELTGSLEGLKM